MLVHVQVEQEHRGVELLAVDRARAVGVDRAERVVDRFLEQPPAVHAQREQRAERDQQRGGAERAPRGRREREVARGLVHAKKAAPRSDTARLALERVGS